MILTFIGMIQLAIGLLVFLTGSLRHAFAFLLVSGLFGGGAAIILPALGGTSIPPIHFAALFVYLRILAPRGGFLGMVPSAIHANRWLVAYTLYGIASAVIAPRLFAGQINVAPMRAGSETGLFDTVPLAPSAQNITTSIYLLGTLAFAIAAYIVCRVRGGAATLISTSLVVGWLNIALGIAAALAIGTPLNDFFELFRNGNYAQLTQSFGDFARLRGLFPESSTFAAFSFAHFVLAAELWYRSIRPVATGSLAIATALTLFFSTSSTAYIGLGGYLVFFVLRIFVMPDIAQGRRVSELAVALFAMAVVVACVFVLSPSVLVSVTDMVHHMTVEKSESSSAEQRLFWAMQGWDAFKASWGLGVGPGSFRSSSLVMAMIGSVGVVGIVSFGAFALQVFQPGRRSTYARTAELGQNVGGAYATAAILALVPPLVSAPSADLGANFAYFAGAALALRPAARRHGTPIAPLTALRPTTGG